MKRFVSFMVEVKSSASMIFTAVLSVYALGDMLFPGHPLSGLMLLEVLLLSLLCGMAQTLIFSHLIFKRMGYLPRIALLGVVLLALVIGFGLLCHWFPADQLEGWAAFLMIFLLVFLGITLGTEMVFRITGRRYTDLLNEKQNQR